MKMAKFLKTLLVAGVVAMCAMAFTACTNGDGSSNGGVAATVNGVTIREDDVTNTIENIRKQSGMEEADAWGNFLASSSMTPETIRERVIDDQINKELVKEGAASLGIAVESSEIDTYVESMKANFDSDEKWQEALKQAGFTEETYRQNIQDSLLQQKVGAHFEEAATVSDEELIKAAETYAPSYDGAKRSSHILIGVENASDEKAMNDAVKKAEKIKKEIEGGKKFEDAAKEYSTDTGSAESGGDVGWDIPSNQNGQSRFVTEYADALEELDKDEISDPVKTQYGVHIIKVTDVFNAPEKVKSIEDFPEDFRSTIEQMAKTTKANEDYTAWVEELKKKAEENKAIVKNPMPEKVPYNVDMSKYSSAAASAEGDGSEVVVEEETTEGSAESADAEASEGGASSASAESASAESASASAESASAESASAESASASAASAIASAASASASAESASASAEAASE